MLLLVCLEILPMASQYVFRLVSKMLFLGFTCTSVEVKWLNPGGFSVFLAKVFFRCVKKKKPQTFKIIRLSGYVANSIDLKSYWYTLTFKNEINMCYIKL